MKARLIISMAIATMISTTAFLSAQSATAGEKLVIPPTRVGVENKVEAKSGIPTVIYGQRGECSKKRAPNFDRVMKWKNFITKKPQNGTLSDGGVSEQRSLRCGKVVPKRALAYTSNPGFIGEDKVVFWGNTVVIINVVADDWT